MSEHRDPGAYSWLAHLTDDEFTGFWDELIERVHRRELVLDLAELTGGATYQAAAALARGLIAVTQALREE